MKLNQCCARGGGSGFQRFRVSVQSYSVSTPDFRVLQCAYQRQKKNIFLQPRLRSRTASTGTQNLAPASHCHRQFFARGGSLKINKYEYWRIPGTLTTLARCPGIQQGRGAALGKHSRAPSRPRAGIRTAKEPSNGGEGPHRHRADPTAPPAGHRDRTIADKQQLEITY